MDGNKRARLLQAKCNAQPQRISAISTEYSTAIPNKQTSANVTAFHSLAAQLTFPCRVYNERWQLFELLGIHPQLSLQHIPNAATLRKPKIICQRSQQTPHGFKLHVCFIQYDVPAIGGQGEELTSRADVSIAQLYQHALVTMMRSMQPCVLEVDVTTLETHWSQL